MQNLFLLIKKYFSYCPIYLTMLDEEEQLLYVQVNWDTFFLKTITAPHTTQSLIIFL